MTDTEEMLRLTAAQQDRAGERNNLWDDRALNMRDPQTAQAFTVEAEEEGITNSDGDGD
ncbi:hypothetical protein [Isoptericola sp. NPDC057391]|uniref:hypothetical protein n=1 Tax=Isoptericola sp. NPDC057391 TaxID=3346117 RepID=UPI003637EB82